MLVVPESEQKEFHFQLVYERQDVLIHPHLQVLIKMNEKTPSGFIRRFYELDLRISRIVFFPLNWRVVHEITVDSPLYGLTQNDYQEKELEFLILLNAFDHVFRQHVYAWHEYMATDVVFDARFITPYETDESGETILDIDNTDQFQKIG